MALHPVIEADRRRPRCSIGARELDHRLRRNAAEGGDAFGRILGGTLAQRVEANRITRDVIAIDEILGDQHVHHAEREGGVRAGNERNMYALLRRLAAIRIDGDQPRAAAFRPLYASEWRFQTIGLLPQIRMRAAA